MKITITIIAIIAIVIIIPAGLGRESEEIRATHHEALHDRDDLPLV